jgi:hypothetical protein
MDDMTKAEALAAAANIEVTAALAALRKLEGKGLTIYRKKIMRGPYRPVSSAPMTDGLRSAIQAYYHDNPDETQSAIAARFNVNSGRVAECLYD